MNTELDNVLYYLNENYNQDSENYNLFLGPKPEVIRFSEHCAISSWACGCVVCIRSILYFIEEDDGNWFLSNDDEGKQSPFNIGWAQSFIKAMEELDKYVKENGSPVYYEGVKDEDGNPVICGYTL